MIIIALLYYQNEKKLYFDLAKTKLQNSASKISSQIILTHMSGKEKTIKNLLFEDKYEFSLYDFKKEKMYGKIEDKINFDKKIIEKEKYFILVDDSTYGHLGVSYIAIKDNSFYKTIKELKQDIILLFLLIYSILASIGFFLAKLFLQPIKDEREKLNNFIKDTTHELNTPISAILMSSEKDTLSKKQIHRIQLAANRISEIYKDLTYVFLEEKEEKKDLKALDINLLVQDQIKYFEAIAEKKQITIVSEIESFQYKIDENDFIRLFNNVLSNAIKYNKPKGSIKITLKSKQLLISDTGIGIDEKKQKDIFKRYFRATSTSGGFGLGLNIVKNICDIYGITLHLYSKKGEGSTFTFNF